MLDKIASFLVCTALAGVSVAAVACNNTSEGIRCTSQCACAGKADDSSCETTCEAAKTKEQDAMDTAGCDTQFSAYEDCLFQNAQCDSATKKYVVKTGACDTQTITLETCTGTTIETTSSSDASSSSSG